MNKRITTDILKITAMVSMLTDHVAVALPDLECRQAYTG